MEKQALQKNACGVEQNVSILTNDCSCGEELLSSDTFFCFIIYLQLKIVVTVSK